MKPHTNAVSPCNNSTTEYPSSVPKSLVPERNLRILQVRRLGVQPRRVEDEVLPTLAVQGPLQLVLGPLSVGVASEDERQEILLHLDGSRSVYRGAASEAAATSRARGVRSGGGGRVRGEGPGAVPVVALVSTVGRLVDLHHAVPSLVGHSMRESHVVGSKIKVLLHVREAQAGALVVILRVQGESLLHLGIGDGGEENAQVSRHVLGGVDTGPSLAIRLVLLVGNDSRAGEVEAVLVELGLVSVGDEITVNARLQLESVLINQGVGRVLESGEVDRAQAGQVAAVASNGRRHVEEEGLSVFVTGSRDESGRHDVCLLEKLLCVAREPGHLEENLGTTGGEAHSCDLVGVSAKVRDVLVDPLESMLHIPETGVARTALVQQGRAVGETGDAEPIVVGDEDEIAAQVELKYRCQ